MQIDIQQCCMLLGTKEDILILCHRAPDGDTVGSAFGLYHALRSLGKRAAVLCSDPLPDKFSYIHHGVEFEAFTPQYIVAVDVATPELLGPALAQYAHCVDLCIDHHISNTLYAQHTLLDARAAAACELVYGIITALGVPVSQPMANALYTGLATDTGCFCYRNTTANTLRTAARLMEAGAESGDINSRLFEKKSRKRMELERESMRTLEYHFHSRCALIVITQEVLRRLEAKMEEVEGIASIPRTIEGVEAAVTLRENRDGTYKVSLRTEVGVDASAICSTLGGGGHVAAAGCTVAGPLEAAKAAVLEAVQRELEA